MKKRVLIGLMLLSCLLSGCNSVVIPVVIPTDLDFNKAMIKLADDTVITVDVKQYHAGSDSVMIWTTDGKKYGVAYTDATFYIE